LIHETGCNYDLFTYLYSFLTLVELNINKIFKNNSSSFILVVFKYREFFFLILVILVIATFMSHLFYEFNKYYATTTGTSVRIMKENSIAFYSKFEIEIEFASSNFASHSFAKCKI